VCISGHGLGHLAQTAPVLNALARRMAGLRITVCTRLARDLLDARIEPPFECAPGTAEAVPCMASSIDVLVSESRAAFARLHRDLDARIEREAEWLRRLRPDLVLANVPYIVLAAARRAGVPALAMSSLNWADVLAAYCGTDAAGAGLAAEARRCYGAADAFLRLAPALSMADLDNGVDVGPVAALGRPRRAALARALGVAPGTRLAGIAFGGIETALTPERWPAIEDLVWLLPGPAAGPRPDLIPVQAPARGLGLAFVDVLAGCDLVITKPGYGTFVEAGCNGVPVLYVERPDWPETAGLVAWLERVGRARPIDRARLWAGALERPVRDLLAAPRPAPAAPHGVAEAARHLADLLAR